MPITVETSPIADDVDPAPRILRILAAVFMQRDQKLGKSLLFSARVLEGGKMKTKVWNSTLGRTLSMERRVKVTRGRRIVKPEYPSDHYYYTDRGGQHKRIKPRGRPKKNLSAEDIAAYKEAVARGEIEAVE